MIIGLGIDIIEIERFTHWHRYSYKQLQKLFSLEEIRYCLEYTEKSAERFAVRWAAKEAFFKAAAPLFSKNRPPWHLICASVTLTHTSDGAPLLNINWNGLNITLVSNLQVHISCSHNKTSAIAFVILETTH